MKYVLLLISLITMYTCKQHVANTSQVESKTIGNDSMEINLPAPKNYYKADGIRELNAFEAKYEKKWKAKPKKFPYSSARNIKVFKLNCMGECGRAPFTHRISKGKEITENNLKTLLKLLGNPDSYNQSTAACHDPKFGLIIYDYEGVPTEFLDICLACNRSSTYPGEIKVKYKNELLYGFSKESRNELKSLFIKWGINYTDTSTLFD